MTPRQLAFLYHLQQGKTEREAAQAMGVIYTTVRRFIQGIRQALDVNDMSEAVRLCASRLHHEAHTLPLGPGKQPGNLISGSNCRWAKAREAGVSLYLEPELIEALRLYASSPGSRMWRDPGHFGSGGAEPAPADPFGHACAAHVRGGDRRPPGRDPDLNRVL
jgi:hypothetical protein